MRRYQRGASEPFVTNPNWTPEAEGPLPPIRPLDMWIMDRDANRLEDTYRVMWSKKDPLMTERDFQRRYARFQRRNYR